VRFSSAMTGISALKVMLQLACSIPEKAKKHLQACLTFKSLRFAFYLFPGR